MIKVKLLTDDAIAPTRGSAHAGGLDLYANENCYLGPCGRLTISTGVAISVGYGMAGEIKPRSKLASKFGIQVLGGVVDADYTGEIMVILFNSGKDPFQVRKGDRIAQLVVQVCDMSTPVVVDKLDDTCRGDDGISSYNLRA